MRIFGPRRCKPTEDGVPDCLGSCGEVVLAGKNTWQSTCDPYKALMPLCEKFSIDFRADWVKYLAILTKMLTFLKSKHALTRTHTIGDHNKRAELENMLQEVSSVLGKCLVGHLGVGLRTFPVTFAKSAPVSSDASKTMKFTEWDGKVLPHQG